jgi:hypothetical protein
MSVDVAEWMTRIEQTFGGSGMVGERLMELMKHEQKLSEKHVGRFKGYVSIMDAFFDFYIQTFQLIGGRDRNKWDEALGLPTAIHIGTMWRFRSSYILFWKGYYVDAQSLLRAVFENALVLCAYNSSAITASELSGLEVDLSGGQASTDEMYRRMNQLASQTDTKVKRLIIGEDSGLEASVRDDIAVVLRVLHIAVHKSKLNLVLHYTAWLRGERPMPIYPTYNEQWASGCMNVSLFFAWMLVRSLPFLQIHPSEFGDEWKRKYDVLDGALATAHDGLQDIGKRVGASIKTFMDRKFGDSKSKA